MSSCCADHTAFFICSNIFSFRLINPPSLSLGRALPTAQFFMELNKEKKLKEIKKKLFI
jgi:hypothetical protein